jgi:hypothetical protein
LIGFGANNDNSSRIVHVAFESTGLYVLDTLEPTSATTENLQIEAGTFLATDTQITFSPSPMESTCPGQLPVYITSYSFDGDRLSLAFANGAMAFERVTPNLISNVQSESGCFQPDGSFVHN